MKNNSITVMVAAYNEEKHLEEAVNGLNNVLSEMFKDYEILIFDDRSTDRTGAIADDLAKKLPNICVVHNGVNKGLGYNYKKAADIAKYEYFSFIPGDNAIKPESIREIFGHIGEADIIIPYTANMETRTFSRRLVSRSFTNSLNLIFGLNVKYYNGIVVHKAEILRKVGISTNSFAYQAEILVKLIKCKGCSYKEVPMYINPEEKSSMFRIKNIVGVFRTVLGLFFDVYFRKELRNGGKKC